MNWILPIENLTTESATLLGGKGESLRKLAMEDLRIPRTLCLTTRAYNEFVDRAGLREKISLELNRKIFSEMRWEEVWDASQRIRLFFLRSSMSDEMYNEVDRILSSTFGDRAVVVRSSAPEEDRSGHSFAGLHASFTHLHGTEDVIRHIRLVWASLWSDAALLYRQELGLDIFTSSMAVLVQEMVPGQASGIFFTQDPSHEDQGLIEGVHGMNPPLVDGKISPDRWVLAAETGQVIDHTAPGSRTHWQPPDSTLTADNLLALPLELKDQTPLDPKKIATLWEAGEKVVRLFGVSQDIEWTFRDETLVLLQARPITTSMKPADGDSRAWYLSLHRSLENLLSLRKRIEEILIPQMQETARELAESSLVDLSVTELASEIRHRWEINRHWASVYWDDFIPFAHGMRLFGQVYNQVMTPEDPYEFMKLLKRQDLISIRRNKALAELAAGVRRRPLRARALAARNMDALDADFRNELDAFVVRYGDLSCTVTGAVDCAPDAGTLANTLLEMAKMPETLQSGSESDQTEALESAFLDACASLHQEGCGQLLSLGRSSYRLRDDDNIILGAIEAQLIAATQEGWRRIERGCEELSGVMSELGLKKDSGASRPPESTPPPMVLDRQITGQPAGPGLARGRARVIVEHRDIAHFKRGEIIVCDGVDPNMTFVMPLAAGIVERRGGMLIHGAIIAREYGLPCVTGVVDATQRIRSGQTVTVDGYLGIVTLAEK
jgi:phosphohistidine swiveling domain-containing protein